MVRARPGERSAAPALGGPCSVRAASARIRAFAAGPVVLLALVVGTPAALATGFTDAGQDLGSHAAGPLRVEGDFRVRGGLFYNLDLDRGVTPSGQPLFPVPANGGQTLSAGDARLRTDLAAWSPSGSLALKMRADVFDGAGMSDRIPAGESARTDALVVDRFYAEALTPVGVLSVGRMGSTWGLGILANGGDCDECDRGNAADRIAFVTPLAGHLFAVAYDVGSVDPTVPQDERPDGFRASRAGETVSIAALRWRNADSIERRRRAGKWTADYGLVLSQREDRDGGAASFLASPSEGIPRGFSARVADVWARLVTPRVRIEAEAAYVLARIEDPSVIPGVKVDPVDARSFGAALESEIGAPDARLTFGLDAGLASGDPAYGFSTDQRWSGPASRGDLRGAQSLPPWDTRADDFRFHPDYRVDRILFREIIGTVTDAAWVRPHASAVLVRGASGALTASLAVVGSRALHPESTPGGDAALGVEVDPTLAWVGSDGLTAVLEHAVLFPLAGLDNPDAELSAKPAQLVRLRLGWRF